MCSVKDLVILVVEPDKDEMKKTCSSLDGLGVRTVLCVYGYDEALTIIEEDQEIDLVIADLRIDNFNPTGLFLCSLAKKKRPDLLFLVSSRSSGVSFVCQSFTGQALGAGADGTIDRAYVNEIENIVPKWLGLAVTMRNTTEAINKGM